MVRLQLVFIVKRALYLAQAPVTYNSMKAKGQHKQEYTRDTKYNEQL